MRFANTSLPRSSNPKIVGAAITFVSAVCLLLVSVTIWSVWHARQVQLREQDTATVNMAHALAQHADLVFKLADTTLIGLTERIANDGLSPQALARLQKLLKLHLSELPQLKGLLIYDKDGRWLVNSEGISNSSGNNADREYFIYHRSHSDLGPHIGFPILSRTTGVWVIPLSRRLNDVNGHFAGVVLATIGIDFFNRVYSNYDIGQNGVLLLALNSGTQLVRWPMLTDSIGKNLAGGPLISLYAPRNESGNAIIVSPFDKIERLVGYTHLKNYPMVVLAALSKREILADWQQDSLLRGTIVAAIAVILGFFGFRLIDQINLRVRAEDDARTAGNALFQLNKTLEKMALQDYLTGLANRRQFDAALKNELSRAKRSASSLALIMIDIDHFKKYNDIYGHLAGDECLRHVGKIIQSAERRTGDLAARYGGEEFIVLLPKTDAQGALKVAEEICQAIRALEITHAGNLSGFVTISAGVNAIMPVTSNDTSSTLIGSADEALYLAKSKGRDQICMY